MGRRAIAALIFGIAGTLVLLALGFWQVQRLAWKEGVIARFEERLAAAPAALPENPERARDDFLRVALEGRLGAEELHVLTSLKPHGPGYRVIAPVETDGGRLVMTDLGFVPEDMKDRALRPVADRVALIGALYWPDEVDGFTPEPDRERAIWFARDLQAMAEALGTEPLLVIAESHDLGPWPIPRRLGVALPNDHLGYAITWFSLALIWAVMSALLVRREQGRSRS